MATKAASRRILGTIGTVSDFKNGRKKLHLENKIDFGIDAAATDIKKTSDKKLEAAYIKLVRDYKLAYIEDPFGEKDFLAFAALNLHFKGKTWVAGDDLTTTNVRNMKKAHAEESVNAVIIKPNQIGTVTETLNAVHLARNTAGRSWHRTEAAKRTMISSRISPMASGPTG